MIEIIYLLRIKSLLEISEQLIKIENADLTTAKLEPWRTIAPSKQTDSLSHTPSCHESLEPLWFINIFKYGLDGVIRTNLTKIANTMF